MCGVCCGACMCVCTHTPCRTHMLSGCTAHTLHFTCVRARMSQGCEKRYVQCACRDSHSRLLPSDVPPICSAAFRQPLRHRASVSHIHGTLAGFTKTQNRGSGALPQTVRMTLTTWPNMPHATGYEPNQPWQGGSCG